MKQRRTESMPPSKSKDSSKPAGKSAKQRTYLSQSDVPLYSLEKALKIPQAIVDNYGKGPATPLEVAAALKVAPANTYFKMQAGASIAYGLTVGGWNAAQIALTPLALKILKPKNEDEPLQGKREALLKPRVIREFLTRYNDSAIPRGDIARNVLEDLNVPRDRTAEVLELILEGARAVGFITESNGKSHANLQGVNPVPVVEDARSDEGEVDRIAELDEPIAIPDMAHTAVAKSADARLTKVFISHGKNQAFIVPIRELLKFGQLEAVVSVEKSTASQPIPQKVMSDMRSCGAAIIHVDGERKLMDLESKEVVALNENVLIEIGAAMALYGERFILLVKDGVKLPSNLQGMYEVRYASEKLDGNETIKLMSSINDMKTKPLPPAP
jgi:predicted nucleotide-binding protein